MFEKLNKVDQSNKNEYAAEIEEGEDASGASSEEEQFEDNIFKYEVTMEQIKDFFDNLFLTNLGKRNSVNKANRTVDVIKRKKTAENAKLRKIQELLKKKISNRNLVKQYQFTKRVKSLV